MTAPARRLPTWYPWYALGLLAVINILNYLDRNVIFALFEPIKADLGLSDAQLGWLGSAYILVFSLAALPAGVLSDLRSRRAVIAGGVAVWSAFTFLSGLARGFWPLFGARAAVGIGEAAYGPASQSLVADWFPGPRRAFSMGILASGVALGGVLGITLGGILEAAYGWRVAFMAVAFPGFILAAMAARLVDPTRPPVAIPVREQLRRLEVGLLAMGRLFAPLLVAAVVATAVGWYLAERLHQSSVIDAAAVGLILALGLAVNIWLWVRALRRNEIDDGPFREQVGHAFDEMLVAVRLVLRTPTLGYLFLGGAMISFGMNGLVGWGPTFLTRELGVSPASAAGLLGGWGIIAGTAGTISGGWVADKLRASSLLGRWADAARIVTLGVGILVGGCFAVALLLVRDLRLVVPLFAIGFYFLTWYNGPMAAAIFDVVPARIGATVMGAYLLFIHLAGDAVAFPLVGLLSDRFGLGRSMMVLPVVAMLGGVVSLLAVRTFSRDADRAVSRPTGNIATPVPPIA